MRAALKERGNNIILALDDPGLALAELVLDQGWALPAATQIVAGSCATLLARPPEPRALVLQHERDLSRDAAMIAAIARHLQIAIGDAEIADLATSLGAGNAAPNHDGAAWWSTLPPMEQEMVAGALGPFTEPEIQGEPPSIIWMHQLFFVGDRPNERATGSIDITGRAHCLLNGPHIMLPPGRWSLLLTMLFSRAAAEHEFLVEIYTDLLIASGKIRPEQEGAADIVLDFVIDPRMERPVDVRVSSQRAAFDGSITVVRARLERTLPPAEQGAP
jgi:hypothetical protein